MKNLLPLFFTVLAFFSACSESPVKTTQSDLFSSWDSTGDQSLNFYDDAPLTTLPVHTILIKGMVEQELSVDLTSLHPYELIVKETFWKTEGDKFKGAYLYLGASLVDILNNARIVSRDEDCFDGITDLCVRVIGSNDTVVLTWGEIFYPRHRNEIIIAQAVRRIVPSKTRELWALPEQSRLIVGQDLLTERNIEAPHTIEIFRPDCAPGDAVNKELPLLSSNILITLPDGLKDSLVAVKQDIGLQTYRSVFYGRGKGIHSTTPFTGYPIDKVLSQWINLNPGHLKRGLVLVVAADGYRCAFSVAEIFNRQEPSSVLLVPRDGDGGRFTLFNPSDFFSDRAIKAIKEIRFLTS